MVLSELVPHMAGVADELTLVRSMSTDSVDHETALRLIHTGKILAGRPTWGSWVVYGLGTENRNLPAYVVLSDPGGLPVDGIRNWSSGWLPATCQGTPFRSGDAPVLHLKTPPGVTPDARAGQLGFLDELNRIHLKRHPGHPELEARIANFEVAAAMQTAVPEALDLASESEATRRMYGLDDPDDARVRHPMPARPPPGRAGRPVRPALPEQPALGHAQQERPRRSSPSAPAPTSPARRWSGT